MPRKPADPDNIKSGTKYKGKFRDENYDRVEVNIKKGKKKSTKLHPVLWVIKVLRCLCPTR